MIRQHATLYLASRALAAAGNIFAVTVFTRLAGTEVYGHYLLMFAAASVINGFSVQWLRYAFFANYRAEEADRLVPTFVALVAAALAIAIPLAVGLILIGGLNLTFSLGALLLAVTIGMYDTTTQVFQTRLEAGRVVIASLLRTVLVVAFGTAGLLAAISPVSLALGIAGAHFVAALPALVALRRLLTSRPTWAVAQRYMVFGWPLLLSFGLGAFAQSVDRFVLNWSGGAASVGGYGAVSDFVRSSFMVFAEALAASLVSIARQQQASGDEASSRNTLATAYGLFLLLAGFGSAGFLMFGNIAFAIMFPPVFLSRLEPLLPVIVASAALLVLRNMYFGQVIYFNKASHLELISTAILLVTNSTFCVIMIPRFGVAGAAWAFLIGQLFSTVFFVLSGRGRFGMPILIRPTIGVAILAAAAVLFGRSVEGHGIGQVTEVALKGAAFAGAFVLGLRMLGVKHPRRMRFTRQRI